MNEDVEALRREVTQLRNEVEELRKQQVWSLLFGGFWTALFMTIGAWIERNGIRVW